MTEEIPAHLLEEQVDMSSFASDDDLSRGKKLAEEFVRVDGQIKQLEALLEQRKARMLELARKEIPEFFDNVLKSDLIGVPETGVDVKVVPYYHSNIRADWPTDQRERAFEWLEREGHGDIIAVTVSCRFRRGEMRDARELEKLIRDSRFGNTNPPTLEMGVPWNTLTALVKEQIESGHAVPLDTLGATVARTAKIVKRRK